MSKNIRNLGSSSASHKAVSLFALLLFGRRPYSLKQLAEYLDCSRQTVLRLVDEIELISGFSVQQWKDNCQNWYQLATPSEKANVCLSQNELQQLVMCQIFLEHLLPATFAQDLKNAVGKAALMAEAIQLPEDVFAASIKGKIDYTPFDEVLRILMAAQVHLQAVEINYCSRLNAAGRDHCFVPVRTLSFHDGLYIRGWSVSDKGTVEIIRPMTLAVHRIKSVVPTRRLLDKATHSKANFPEESDYFGMAHGSKPFSVTVRFTLEASPYIKERIWSKDQKVIETSDGSLSLTFTAQSEYEVIKWVLGFGEDAELVAPKALRDKIKDVLHLCLRHYY